MDRMCLNSFFSLNLHVLQLNEFYFRYKNEDEIEFCDFNSDMCLAFVTHLYGTIVTA